MPTVDASPESPKPMTLLLSEVLGKLRPQAPVAQGHRTHEELSQAEPSSNLTPPPLRLPWLPPWLPPWLVPASSRGVGAH